MTNTYSSDKQPWGDGAANREADTLSAPLEGATVETAAEAIGDRQRGAQPGNTNAVRHGLRSKRLRNGSELNALGPGAEFIERRISAFRAALVAELRMIQGDELPLMAQLVVQSACRHETTVQLAYRQLRSAGESLEPSERVAILKLIGAETTARDKALASVGLDCKPPADPARTFWPVPDDETPEQPAAAPAEGSTSDHTTQGEIVPACNGTEATEGETNDGQL